RASPRAHALLQARRLHAHRSGDDGDASRATREAAVTLLGTTTWSSHVHAIARVPVSLYGVVMRSVVVAVVVLACGGGGSGGPGASAQEPGGVPKTPTNVRSSESDVLERGAKAVSCTPSRTGDPGSDVVEVMVECAAATMKTAQDVTVEFET